MVRKCLFSYFITETEAVIPELPIKEEFGKYKVFVDGNTPFSYASNGDVECIVYGYAVNVVTGEEDTVADTIVKNCKSIADAVDYEKYLGGKYVLFFKIEEQYYVQGDATCSIPVFYDTDDGFISSSNYQYIVNAKQYCADGEFDLIRKSGDISQAMPYDITPCKQIKQLIPNHYLSVNDRSAVRFVNFGNVQKPISVDEATEIAEPMIKKLLACYLRNFKIYCPITSGRDSRVVLAFLAESGADFSCYTIKHPEHSDNAQDIVIPAELCRSIGVEHRLVEDVNVDEGLISEIDRVLGKDNYSKRTLRIAMTVNEYFGDGAIINGDIIGQVGKCSLHRDIPRIFATPSYFRCKLHNYSNGAKKQLKLWLDEIKASGEKVNTFDLFSIENRMGRWAGQENLMYNTVSQVYLNIFNSRSIIYTWTAVDRKIRKKSLLHLGLINKTYGALTEIPFEKDESIVFRISKSTGIAYLLSSYAKFYIEKTRFEKGRK